MKFHFFALFSVLLTLASALNAPQLLKQKEKSPLNSIIKLTKTNFERILGGPRDSYILLLLTATNAQVGCTACVTIQPEFEKLANSWFKEHPEGDNLFFARADFADGHAEIFQKFQLNNVPRLYLYSPSDEAHPFSAEYDVLNIPQNGAEFAPYIAGALNDLIKKRIVIHEEADYSGIILTFIFTFSSVFLLKKFSGPVRLVLASRPLWGGTTVLAILMFISGYMFNIIRGTPYIRPSGPNGEVEYFIRGQQTQLGAEVQVLSFVYAILAFSVVALVTKAKYIKNEKVHLIVVVIMSGVVLLFFSVLLSIFKFKSPSYPFQLLQVWSP